VKPAATIIYKKTKSNVGAGFIPPEIMGGYKILPYISFCSKVEEI
jgi:hypothetical protein